MENKPRSFSDDHGGIATFQRMPADARFSPLASPSRIRFFNVTREESFITSAALASTAHHRSPHLSPVDQSALVPRGSHRAGLLQTLYPVNAASLW